MARTAVRSSGPLDSVCFKGLGCWAWAAGGSCERADCGLGLLNKTSKTNKKGVCLCHTAPGGMSTAAVYLEALHIGLALRFRGVMFFTMAPLRVAVRGRSRLLVLGPAAFVTVARGRARSGLRQRGELWFEYKEEGAMKEGKLPCKALCHSLQGGGTEDARWLLLGFVRWLGPCAPDGRGGQYCSRCRGRQAGH